VEVGVGVSVSVGVKDNAAIACCACDVRAMEVNVAFAGLVGEGVPLGTDVWVGGMVCVAVNVGARVSVTVGV
jgi:hypothetical protein